MKSVFIKTFGCTLNQRDSQDLIDGVPLADTENSADLIVINTCGVKEQTETKIYKYIKNNISGLKNKEIIVTGCLVDINPKTIKGFLPNSKFYGIKDKSKLLKYLDKFRIKNKHTGKKKNHFNETTKTIIIANGCLGNCSYCAVKFARGKLQSKTITEITNEIQETLKKGTKEILLTAQDTACYGLDINTTIVELLDAIIKIPGDYKIRLGMGNPQHLKKFKAGIVKAFKSDKVYKFLHIPVQSGNDRILKKMNRYYSRKEYITLIKYFKTNIKDLTLATDIIVGFPTETEKEFNDTLSLIKFCKFDIVNISRFGQRLNVEANNYPDLSGNIKKERSRITTQLCSKIALENNKKWIGKTKEILITEFGKNNTSIGRTNEYKQVVVFKKHKLGENLKLKIKDAKSGYLLT